MQFAKDSFYMALRARLAEVNPERTIAIDGETAPAILVTENEPVTSAETLADCFYVQFGAVRNVGGMEQGDPSLMAISTSVTYRTRGAADGSADRGRAMAALDSELLAICLPARTAKCDYTQEPALDLGSCVFWTAPQLGETIVQGAELSRMAQLTLFFCFEEQSA